MNIEKLELIVADFTDKNYFCPFFRLLNNIKKRFDKYDPIYVLSKSTAVSYHCDEKKHSKCICTKGHLLHVYTCEFNNETYVLGSECIHSLYLLNELKDDLIDEEKDTINRLLVFYNTLKSLHKKKCKNFKKCGKKVDMKKNRNAPKVYQNYCYTCVLTDDLITCSECNNSIYYDGKTVLCNTCILKKNGKKYCDSHNCKHIVEAKYKYCFSHKDLYNINKKKCSKHDCRKMIDKKWDYCYEHRSLRTTYCQPIVSVDSLEFID